MVIYISEYFAETSSILVESKLRISVESKLRVHQTQFRQIENGPPNMIVLLEFHKGLSSLRESAVTRVHQSGDMLGNIRIKVKLKSNTQTHYHSLVPLS